MSEQDSDEEILRKRTEIIDKWIANKTDEEKEQFWEGYAEMAPQVIKMQEQKGEETRSEPDLAKVRTRYEAVNKWTANKTDEEKEQFWEAYAEKSQEMALKQSEDDNIEDENELVDIRNDVIKYRVTHPEEYAKYSKKTKNSKSVEEDAQDIKNQLDELKDTTESHEKQEKKNEKKKSEKNIIDIPKIEDIKPSVSPIDKWAANFDKLLQVSNALVTSGSDSTNQLFSKFQNQYDSLLNSPKSPSL